jgi:hypothetical protein
MRKNMPTWTIAFVIRVVSSLMFFADFFAILR